MTLHAWPLRHLMTEAAAGHGNAGWAVECFWASAAVHSLEIHKVAW